jgi:endonuclease I
MKKNLLLLYFWLLPLLILAQAPAGYYTNAEGKSGAELKTALFNIIKGHTTVSYDGLYTVYPTSDNLPGNKVWDMYSIKADGTAAYFYTQGQKKCGSYSNEGDCYNREHSMPQSWFNSASPMVSDAFHVYPTDGKVNGIRSSFPFGEVKNATITTSNGSMLGSGDPALGYTGTVFEPIDEFKGDFARTYFYMATRYEDKIASWNGNGSAGTILDGTAYPAYKTWYLQTMLKWHRQDPVSKKEIDRNEAVYKVQHNRNPYIDNADYAEYVWGGQTPSGVSISDITATPNLTNETTTVKVSATVIGSKAIALVKLKWGLTPTLGTEIAMNKTTGDVYESTTSIPAQAQNTTVYYAVFGQDINGGSSTSITKSYTVGKSLTISSISTSPTEPNETNAVGVSAKISSASQLSSVKLFWGLTATPTAEIAMINSGNETYTASIPAQVVGSKVYFFVSATNTTATETSATDSYTVANSVAPTNLISENFSSCIPSDWVVYSVASNKNWECVNNAQVEVNGYNKNPDVASEDWLITKNIDATTYKSLILSFKTKKQYDDLTNAKQFTVLYSNNYLGSGDPKLATWTEISWTIPTQSTSFTTSGNINLPGALEGSKFYVAYKYTSTGTTSGKAALWGIDDILIVGTPTTTPPANQAPAITTVLHTPGNPTVGQNVTYSANVTDADGTVKNVTLKYGTTEGVLDQSAPMALISGSTYATTAVFPNAAKLYYKVEATDNLDLLTTSSVITVTATIPTNQAPTIINIQHLPNAPSSGESVTYSASVTDVDGSVKNVTLKYGTTEGVLDQSAPMALISGSTYATTAVFPNTAKLYYKVEATDNLDLATISDVVTITVPANQAPVVTNITVSPAAPQQGAAVTISTTAIDSDGSISSIKLLYGTTAENLSSSIAMNLVSGNSYNAIVTAPQASILYFKIEATDNLGSKTTSSLQTVNLATGVGHVSSEGFTIYPNPAVNELNISLPTNKVAKIRIFDLTGKIVATFESVSSSEPIDISSLRNGIYMVRISTENTTITKKITISK